MNKSQTKAKCWQCSAVQCYFYSQIFVAVNEDPSFNVVVRKMETRANRAVAAATGGFIWDEETRELFAPENWKAVRLPVENFGLKVDGEEHTPQLKDLQVQVIGDEMQVRSLLSITTSGVTIFLESINYYRIGMGQQSLEFRESRSPAIRNWVRGLDRMASKELGNRVLSLRLQLANRTAKVLSQEIMVASLLGMLERPDQVSQKAVSDLLDQGLTGRLPSVDGLFHSANGPVSWLGEGYWSQVEFNGGLVISGK